LTLNLQRKRLRIKQFGRFIRVYSVQSVHVLLTPGFQTSYPRAGIMIGRINAQTADVRGPEPRSAVELPIWRLNALASGRFAATPNASQVPSDTSFRPVRTIQSWMEQAAISAGPCSGPSTATGRCSRAACLVSTWRARPTYAWSPVSEFSRCRPSVPILQRRAPE
jgi:hypothetical protein